MPVSAVVRKGTVKVNVKSTIDALGTHAGPAISIFSFDSVSVMTVNRVTSLPVPAVVGIATIGTARSEQTYGTL